MGELSFAVGIKNLVLDTTSIAGGEYSTRIDFALGCYLLKRDRQCVHRSVLGRSSSSSAAEYQDYDGYL